MPRRGFCSHEPAVTLAAQLANGPLLLRASRRRKRQPATRMSRPFEFAPLCAGRECTPFGWVPVEIWLLWAAGCDGGEPGRAGRSGVTVAVGGIAGSGVEIEAL